MAKAIIRDADALLDTTLREGRVVAVVTARTGYDALIEGLRARVVETNLNSSSLDELSGLTPGYSGKLLGAAQTYKFGWMAVDHVCCAGVALCSHG